MDRKLSSLERIRFSLFVKLSPLSLEYFYNDVCKRAFLSLGVSLLVVEALFSEAFSVSIPSFLRTLGSKILHSLDLGVGSLGVGTFKIFLFTVPENPNSAK